MCTSGGVNSLRTVATILLNVGYNENTHEGVTTPTGSLSLRLPLLLHHHHHVFADRCSLRKANIQQCNASYSSSSPPLPFILSTANGLLRADHAGAARPVEGAPPPTAAQASTPSHNPTNSSSIRFPSSQTSPPWLRTTSCRPFAGWQAARAASCCLRWHACNDHYPALLFADEDKPPPLLFCR